MDLPEPAAVEARHVVVVVAHGLRDDLPPLDDLPNLKSMRRLGFVVEPCVVQGRAPLQALLLDGDAGGLAGAAARGGRRLLLVLPWRPAAWVAAGVRGPHCAVVEERLSTGTRSWDDLLEAAPQVLGGAEPGVEDVAEFLRRNVIPRFPGMSTRLQEDAEPLQAWLTWISDAFLRGLWYASARWPGGVVAVVCHPAPRLLAEQGGPDGYLHGLAVIDDLIGRLLVLSEHRELDGSAVILCGDAGISGPDPDQPAGGASTPVLVAGPGIESGRLPGGTGIEEIGGWLRELAAVAGGADAEPPR